MGLLQQSDWGPARWIEYPGRTEAQPMPIFARAFDLDRRKRVSDARLYLSGVGLHLPTLNGRELSDEVLAPGNSNYQLSSEYRTYDITDDLRAGANTLDVRLGNGPAYVRRSVTNPAVGRTAPYSWWQSQLKGSGTLTADAAPGTTTVTLNDVTGYHVGGTIDIDTGNGGDNLESRTITAIGSSDITFTPGLDKPHSTGATVTGSGNNIAASDASAGAAVTPRMIARLEITYTNGSSDVIVSDRSWRAALGPLVTDAWYSGSDYDARREQAHWDSPAPTCPPPPNGATAPPWPGWTPASHRHRTSPPSSWPARFMESTTANPGGMTTIGERWNRGDSKNHMILAQIEEWFHSGLAGIRAADGSTAYRKLVIQPKPVGDLTFVKGSYTTPQGVAKSEWSRGQRTFKLTVEVPANTTAEVWVPAKDRRPTTSSQRADFLRMESGYAVYGVPSGSFTFVAATTG
ncbi:hypothetical protein GCM10010517_40320 [Streptosporangium fragile]|uniref:Alpha-L-rhamnosidase n=1 Tax=Streptosporangium fragile TaxID=46186 RepID=A0ABN3W003_9ACTN